MASKHAVAFPLHRAGAGYMIYKGFSRMGQRMERSSAVLGKQLNSAVRWQLLPRSMQCRGVRGLSQG